MKIKTITYIQVKNLGNYENQKFEVLAELNEDDDPSSAAQELQSLVNSWLDKATKKEPEDKPEEELESKNPF